ncbi:cytochrome P450 [Aspergillus cavernicola]|uniref:Cytochrome P450 n=1 Tax=Aspergillus cavernicola TaxID=176166 RepID=A0ABR4HHT8_9EURO
MLADFLQLFCENHTLDEKGVYLGGTSLLYGNWLTSLEFIIDGAGIIADVYRRKIDGTHSTFAIPALGEYQTLVSTERHIRELGRCPERILSFNEAMEQRLRHKYTMFGFDDKGIDPHHSLVTRVLRVYLRTAIPALQVELQLTIQEAMRKAISEAPAAVSPGWKQVSAVSLARGITARVNNQVLVGEDLAANPGFHKATLRYNQDVVITMELCRHIPSMLVPVTAMAMMAWSGAMKQVARCLTSLIEERLLQDADRQTIKKRRDCVQWIMDCSRTSDQRTVLRLVQQTIGLMFASAHQIPMALIYAIYNLCIYPEYIGPLRREIDQVRKTKEFKDQFSHMPLMDSFLRESARLNPLDALSIQRLVLTPYTLSGNGPRLAAGNLVAVPQEAIMRDSRNYANANVFDGFRFVAFDEKNDQGETIQRACPKFTDVNWKYPYWGSEKRACPGRWYVSSILKQILMNLIMDYDFKLAHNDSPRSFIWTTAIIPHYNMTLLMRERK